jgi:L-seryl-tRNA(Ser) seleniumtransferase
MKVHKSNYDILGFTEEAELEDLVEIGHRHGLPVIFDMGNGLMLDMSEYGLREPNVPASLATGIDVILFSGDKLLGGPQAGIIAGRKDLIAKMKKHPLARAMRVDKMTFAALEATLAKYRDPSMALRDIPILNMIASSGEEMKARAERLADEIYRAAGQTGPGRISLEIVPVLDQIGGGSAPMVRLPGWAVAVSDGRKSADTIERSLRKADVPVIARINEDRLLLCVRTIAEDELATVAAAFKK